ncbi:MAG TPA: cytochrome c biogenesis protein CcsA [bacterium]|nr:cytochrome c biogenesis protein CcsA [bacterium]
MGFGQILIYALLCLNILTFVYYLLSIDGAEGWNKAGRAALWAKAGLSSLGVFYLGSLFVHDRFAFKYVFEHSEISQELIYKISGIWAGQEGTFLLWVCFLAITALVMAFAMKSYEKWSMVFFAGLELALCALLIHGSPFAPLGWEAPDGAGMNALLKNPWMALHPPVMFLGYALAAAPFAIFLAGLAKGETTAWTKAARPWAVLSWCVLGIGIFMGSYWAYEVLGWGGYWGWDPVENASLFAWIALGALLHGMLLQNRNRRFVFWNAVMVSIAYFTVLYATFLTRSGVLSDVSVHSFQGGSIYLPILLALIVTAAAASAAVVWQGVKMSKDLPPERAAKTDARDVLLYGSVIAMWAFFAFVFMGTNWPIFSKWFTEGTSTFDERYYNATSMVAALPLAILLAACPAFFMRRAGAKLNAAPFAAGAVVGVAGAIIAVAIGVKNATSVALVFFSCAAAVSNLWAFASFAASRKMNWASYLAHIGAALVLVGVITSSAAKHTDRFGLLEGQSEELAGFTFVVKEIRPFEYGDSVAIEIGGRASASAEISYVSDEWHNKAVNKPYVMRMFAGDLYLTPVQLAPPDGNAPASGPAGKVITLLKGKSALVDGVEITFDGFDASRMQEGVVGVKLSAALNGATENLIASARMGA